MTPEQQALVLAIICQLDIGAITGEYPHEECKYCNGRSTGYYDSQDFTHDVDCVMLKIAALRETTRKLED